MRKTQRSDRLNPAAPATNAAPGTNLKRRGFLLALGAGGAGAAAIAAQKISRTIEPAGTAAAPADGKGYSVTGHVRRYYSPMKG